MVSQLVAQKEMYEGRWKVLLSVFEKVGKKDEETAVNQVAWMALKSVVQKECTQVGEKVGVKEIDEVGNLDALKDEKQVVELDIKMVLNPVAQLEKQSFVQKVCNQEKPLENALAGKSVQKKDCRGPAVDLEALTE